jgi:hypothetical protein
MGEKNIFNLLVHDTITLKPHLSYLDSIEKNIRHIKTF